MLLRAGDRAQPRRPVRAAGDRGGRRARRRGRRGRRLLDRRAGGVRRDAVHRAVHGRGAGRGVVLPAAAALAVFVGLGLGLALPFLLLGFVPALRRALPRPGAWMDDVPPYPRGADAADRARAGLGARPAGRVDGMALGLAAACCSRSACGGRGGGSGRFKPAAWWPALVGAVLVAVALVATVPRGAGAATARGRRREPFNEAQLAELRAHRPVFLYFTADWCLTCKVNEKAAIERRGRRRLSPRRGWLVGDWTRGDPRSAASWPRMAARACPSTSGTRRARRRRPCRRS